MGVIILAISFILLFLCTIHLAPKAGLGGLRNAFLITCVLWTLLMFVGSELLSLPHWVNFWGLLGYWLLISIVLGIYLWRINFSLSWSIIPKIKFSRFEKVLLSVVGLILGVTLFIGLYSPPNNPDSMVYHMARVAHWMQNQSVHHYATQIEMQICAQPLSELIILHFQVLSGSDHFASFMQWFSLLASLVGLSSVTKIIGGNKKAQILTVFVGVTIPMAILQASSTQNDLAVSFWVIAFSYFIILSIKRPHILVSLLAGSSLGLALLTKGTGYIFASPLVLVYGWVVVYKLIKLRNEAFLLIKYGLVISIMTVLLNSIHYQRNYSLYNHPFGMIPWLKLNNELHSVPALVSNVERNMVLHISSFYKPVSNKINKFLKNSHQRIGLKISDSRTTYHGSWALPVTIRLSDDSTRNLVHTL